MKDCAKLVGIENNHEITRASDPQFWYMYQQSILLTLKEEGILNDVQYWYAEKQLKKQLHIAF